MKKQNKRAVIILTITAIAGVLVYGNIQSEPATYTRTSNDDTGTTTRTVEQESKKEEAIEAIKNRPEFKKRVNAAAERIYWREKRKETKTKYEEKMQTIEKNLESVRKQELSL